MQDDTGAGEGRKLPVPRQDGSCFVGWRVDLGVRSPGTGTTTPAERVVLAAAAADRAQATRGGSDQRRPSSDSAVEPTRGNKRDLLALHNTKLYAKDTAGPEVNKARQDSGQPLPAEVRRADSFSGKLLSLFRPAPNALNTGAGAVISLPTSHQFSSTSGDEDELSPQRGGSPSPPELEPGVGEPRSFLDAMLQWREPAPAPPQTLALLGGEVGGGGESSSDMEPSSPILSASSGGLSSTGGPEGSVVGKLLRLLPSRATDLVGPLVLCIRSVTGEEFELTIPRGPVGEIGAQIRMGIERTQGMRASGQRVSRSSFSLDRIVQQIHIKGNAYSSASVATGVADGPANTSSGVMSSGGGGIASGGGGGNASSAAPAPAAGGGGAQGTGCGETLARLLPP
jgi:hypothetical protein